MAEAGRKRLASPPVIDSDTDFPCISIASAESSSNDESIGWELDRRHRKKKAKLAKLNVRGDSSDAGSAASSSAKAAFQKPRAPARQGKKKSGEHRREAESLKCPPDAHPSSEEGKKHGSPTRNSRQRSLGDTTSFLLPAGGKQPSPAKSEKGKKQMAAISTASGVGLNVTVASCEESGREKGTSSTVTIPVGGKAKSLSHEKGNEGTSRSITTLRNKNERQRGTASVDRTRRCSEAVQKKRHTFALMTEKIDKSLLQYQHFHKFIKNYISGRKVLEIRPIRNNQHYLIAFESAPDAAHVMELCNADKGRVTLKPAGEREKAIRSYPLVVLRVPSSISEEEFLDLASEGGNPVLSATRLKSRARLGAPIEKMRIVVDSLESRNDLLDQGFRLGFQRLPTESWLVAPSLPRCRYCQGYHHIARNCPGSTPKCGYCGEEHKSSECRKKTEPQAYRCANCGGHHRSDSYDCPLRKQVIAELPQRLSYAEIVSLRSRGMTPRDVREVNAVAEAEAKQKTLLPEKTSTASRPADATVSSRETVVSKPKTEIRRGTPASSEKQNRQTENTFPSSCNNSSSLNATAVNWNSLFHDVMGFLNSENRSMADLLQIIMKWSPVLLNLLGKLFPSPHHE